jgi:hypothetical protein
MACADFCRREQSSLNREAQPPKVSPNPLRSTGREHAADVFDENKPRAGLDDDTSGVRPEISLVVLPEPLPGQAVRLARDAANEAIHDSTPRAAVEGGNIAPQSGFSHETLLHRANQVRGGEGFPLHEHDAASAWDCQFNAEVKSSASGAEADEVEALGT